MTIVTQSIIYVLLIAITIWMDVNMKEDVKESSESKWDTLNQMFLINQLVNKYLVKYMNIKQIPGKFI